MMYAYIIYIMKSKILLSVFGIFFILLIVYQVTEISKHKPFWQDEDNAQVVSCAPSYWAILTKGAINQCSPAPLYYLLQKFNVNQIKVFNENILARYRLISIISCFFILLVFYFVFFKEVGAIWAFLILPPLILEPLFFQFSAEDRPYMLWISLFTFVVVIAARLSSRPEYFQSHFYKFSIIFFSLALLLTASPGLFQAGIASIICIYFLWREQKKIVHLFVPLGILFCIVGVYYSLNTCKEHDAGPYDLLLTGNYHLIIGVIRLLIPKGPENWILNIFFLVGFISPYLVWKNKLILDSKNSFAYHLSLHVIFQISLTLLLAVMIVINHYFFIQRVFLYLLPCRALLVGTGGFFLFRILVNRFQNFELRIKYGFVFFTIAMLGFSAYLANDRVRRQIVAHDFAWKYAQKVECDDWSGNFNLFITRPFFDKGSSNQIVRFSEELERCGWKASNKKNNILFTGKTSGSDWYRIIQKDEMEGTRTLSQCGKKVEFHKFH